MSHRRQQPASDAYPALHTCIAAPTQIHVKTQSVIAKIVARIKNDRVPNSNAVIDSNNGIEKSNSKLQITTAADKLTATWNELNSRVLKGVGLVAGLEIEYSTESIGG
jgi:hypothetical protein